MFVVSVAIMFGLFAIIVPFVAWFFLQLSRAPWGTHNSTRLRVLTAGDYATCFVPALLLTIGLLGLALHIFSLRTRLRDK